MFSAKNIVSVAALAELPFVSEKKIPQRETKIVLQMLTATEKNLNP
jgi:hypothetical protein